MVEVWAQPGASCDEVVGLHDGALKIRVSIPPDSGQANKRILAMLADYFGVPKSAVIFKLGRVLRRKFFVVENPRRQQAILAASTIFTFLYGG